MVYVGMYEMVLEERTGGLMCYVGFGIEGRRKEREKISFKF